MISPLPSHQRSKASPTKRAMVYLVNRGNFTVVVGYVDFMLVLAYPDFGKDFVLKTDASDYGVGAVLPQLDDSGHEKVFAYASKALTPREQKCSTTEKEALAVVFGTAHFRVHLLGRHFKLITDHNGLRWLHTMEAKGRLARWIIDLQEFVIMQTRSRA